jgi:transposase
MQQAPGSGKAQEKQTKQEADEAEHQHQRLQQIPDAGRRLVRVDCMDKYDVDGRWDGIKGYVTNTELSAGEVIANYGNLWYIERAFRFNKSDLAVRPISHRLRNRIEGHMHLFHGLLNLA